MIRKATIVRIFIFGFFFLAMYAMMIWAVERIKIPVPKFSQTQYVQFQHSEYFGYSQAELNRIRRIIHSQYSHY